MKQARIEAEAYTSDYKERLIYMAGYTSCLKNLEQWLLKESTDEHISSVYEFIAKEGK